MNPEGVPRPAAASSFPSGLNVTDETGPETNAGNEPTSRPLSTSQILISVSVGFVGICEMAAIRKPSGLNAGLPQNAISSGIDRTSRPVSASQMHSVLVTAFPG